MKRVSSIRKNGHTNVWRRGFTLVELLLATGIGVFILTALIVSFVAISNAFDSIGKYSDMDTQSRNTMNLMSRDIRQTGHLTNWTSTNLQFTNVDGTVLRYTYQTNGTLTYSNGNTGGSGVLLSNCTSLAFSVFQRTPTNGPVSFYTASNAVSAKGILMRFTCIKTNYQGTTSSETSETTTIVMRN